SLIKFKSVEFVRVNIDCRRGTRTSAVRIRWLWVGSIPLWTEESLSPTDGEAKVRLCCSVFSVYFLQLTLDRKLLRVFERQCSLVLTNNIGQH
ncbi:AAEL006402-PA, partial [Aedes aegypti]